jgi:hypothetical protein
MYQAFVFAGLGRENICICMHYTATNNIRETVKTWCTIGRVGGYNHQYKV